MALATDERAAERAAPRLRAFVAWVVRRAAPHVRRLHLQINLAAPEADDMLPTAVACALACCASGGLDELFLSINDGSVELGWVAALTPLRRLKIDTFSGCTLTVKQQMDHLTRMEGLSLCECPWSGWRGNSRGSDAVRDAAVEKDALPCFDAAGGAPLDPWDASTRLPPSLTYLHLDNGSESLSLRQVHLPRVGRSESAWGACVAIQPLLPAASRTFPLAPARCSCHRCPASSSCIWLTCAAMAMPTRSCQSFAS